MRYLGCVTCQGTLSPKLGISAPSTLEIECYEQRGGVVTASGEIESRPGVIALLKGGVSVAFVTDDGHALRLALCDPRSAPRGPIAQVSATGDLPVSRDGSLGWFTA
jgi:hypothetical protein